VRYLLFSECLQNDFVAPIAPGAPLPNELHIGRGESRRLLGDPEGRWAVEGPLARFLRAFQAGVERDHAGIHVRDWHDPDDPLTRAHLEHFGTHCVRGTAGARFVEPLVPVVEAGGIVVDSAVLSDFVGTTLEGAVRPLLGPEVRAGIIGVWTDFKVQYLAYELMTRLGLREIAVCGALTASRSRLAHRQALEHLSANLGVAVIDSIPEFLAWLGIEAASVAAAVPVPRSSPTLALAAGASLDAEERRLVEHLFRECREVRLTPIGGGYSGSRVFGCRPVDRLGRHEIPFVVKIDRHDRIARERVAVESVENLLGANAPRLADYVDLETRGAIKYHFATMNAGEVRTLQRAVREAPDPHAVGALFERVIDRLLRRLYQSPVLDRLDLFDYYSYQARYARATLERMASLAEVAGDRVLVPGLDGDLRSPAAFYSRLFDEGGGEAEEVPCAIVHGDLNLANVLLDEAFNTWLIDYYWTRMGHALDDVAKLENDLKFLMIPLDDDDALARAASLERHLVGQEDLLAALPSPPAALLEDAALARVWPAIATLRALAADLLRGAGLSQPVPARQYRIAQLRYSAHTTSFAECSLRQKRLALVSTCLLADRLLADLDHSPAPGRAG
jgi:nicotinamidase-related amidase